MLWQVVHGDDETAGVALSLLKQRRDRERASTAGPERTQRTRRGSWKVKPRQAYMYRRGSFGDGAAGAKKEEWEHDPTRSVWNKYFPEAWLQGDYSDLVAEEDDDEEEADRRPTWYGARFREEFHVPFTVFRYHLRLVIQSGRFPDRFQLDGSGGRRAHPVHLKLAFVFVQLCEGITFKRGEMG